MFSSITHSSPNLGTNRPLHSPVKAQETFRLWMFKIQAVRSQVRHEERQAWEKWKQKTSKTPLPMEWKVIKWGTEPTNPRPPTWHHRAINPGRHLVWAQNPDLGKENSTKKGWFSGFCYVVKSLGLFKFMSLRKGQKFSTNKNILLWTFPK